MSSKQFYFCTEAGEIDSLREADHLENEEILINCLKVMLYRSMLGLPSAAIALTCVFSMFGMSRFPCFIFTMSYGNLFDNVNLCIDIFVGSSGSTAHMVA